MVACLQRSLVSHLVIRPDTVPVSSSAIPLEGLEATTFGLPAISARFHLWGLLDILRCCLIAEKLRWGEKRRISSKKSAPVPQIYHVQRLHGEFGLTDQTWTHHLLHKRGETHLLMQNQKKYLFMFTVSSIDIYLFSVDYQGVRGRMNMLTSGPIFNSWATESSDLKSKGIQVREKNGI